MRRALVNEDHVTNSTATVSVRKEESGKRFASLTDYDDELAPHFRVIIKVNGINHAAKDPDPYLGHVPYGAAEGTRYHEQSYSKPVELGDHVIVTSSPTLALAKSTSSSPEAITRG